MKKRCKHCLRPFTTNKSKDKFCSEACKNNYGKKIKPNRAAKETELKEPTAKIPALKVVKGDLFNTIKRTQRTADFLTFCHANFWFDQNFSEDRTNFLKQLIAEHFRDSSDIDLTFKQLVQRAVLAKRAIEQHTNSSIAEPEDWFNIDYNSGLAGTARKYRQLHEQRKTIPHYQLGISIFAEAILAFCESKNLLEFFAYRDQLIVLHEPDLIQMYMNAIVHIQFLNFQH